MDPVSPQRPSTSLVPSGDNFLQRRCLKTLSEAVAYTEKFKNLCRRRFGSLIRAWRELLDPQGVGRVGFVKFCEAARLMGFERVSILWKVLDSDGSKFITLDIWDPPSYRALMEFRHICFREYGGLLETFRYALDLDGSGTCRKSVLAKFLRSFEYMGDVDTLWNALDNGRGGFITVEELGFLLHWTGERFTISAMDRDFAFRGERLKRAQEERRLERRKRQHEMARQQQERVSITDQRTLRHSEAPRPFTSGHIRQLVNRKHAASIDHIMDYSIDSGDISMEDLASFRLDFAGIDEPPSLSDFVGAFTTEEVSFHASFLTTDEGAC